jgi:hypothetical protein
VHFGGEEIAATGRDSYGFACCSFKHQLELDLCHTQPGLSALRRKHDGISMSRILLQRLATGMGARNVRWIEE